MAECLHTAGELNPEWGYRVSLISKLLWVRVEWEPRGWGACICPLAPLPCI